MQIIDHSPIKLDACTRSWMIVGRKLPSRFLTTLKTTGFVLRCTSKTWWNSTVKSNSPSTHLRKKIIMKSYVSISFICIHYIHITQTHKQSSFCCISVAECNQPPPCRGSKLLSSLDHKGGPQRHCRYCLGTTWSSENVMMVVVCCIWMFPKIVVYPQIIHF